MADLEYGRKVEEMQKYLPFLEGLIKNLKSSKNEKRELQLTKIESLYTILINKDKKLNIDVLRKCEIAILKLYNKVEKSFATSPAKSANEVSSDAQLIVQKDKNIATTSALPQKNVPESTKPSTAPLLSEVLPALSLSAINNLLDIAKKCNEPSSEGGAQSKPDAITVNPNSGYNRIINTIESDKAPKPMTGDPRVVNSSASPSSDFESIRRKLAATRVNSSIIEENFDCPPSPFLQSERNGSIGVNHNISKMVPEGISDLPTTSCTSTVRNNLTYQSSSLLQSEKSRTDVPKTYPSSLDPLGCHPNPLLIPQSGYSPNDVGYTEIPKVMDPRLKSGGTCVNPGTVKDNFLQSSDRRTGASTSYLRHLDRLNCPPSPPFVIRCTDRSKLTDPRLKLAGAHRNPRLKGNFVQSNDSRTGVSTTYPNPLVSLDCPPSPSLNPRSTYSATDVGYNVRPKVLDPRLKISAACTTSSMVNESCYNTVKRPIESVQSSFPYRPSPTQGIPSLLSVKPNIQNISMPILNACNEIRPLKVFTRKPHLVHRFNKEIPVERNLFRKDSDRVVARNSSNPNIAKKDFLPDKGQVGSDGQEEKLLETVAVQIPTLSCLDKMYRNDAYDTVNRSIRDFKIPKIQKTVTGAQAIPVNNSNDKEEPCRKEKEEKLSTELGTKEDTKPETETVKSDLETMGGTVDTDTGIATKKEDKAIANEAVSNSDPANDDETDLNQWSSAPTFSGENSEATSKKLATNVDELIFESSNSNVEFMAEDQVPTSTSSISNIVTLKGNISKTLRHKSLSQGAGDESDSVKTGTTEGKVINEAKTMSDDQNKLAESLSSESLNHCNTIKPEAETSMIDEENMVPVGSSLNTEPMSEDDTPLSDLLKSLDRAGLGSKGLSHAEVKSEKIAEKLYSKAETMSDNDTVTTEVRISKKPVRRSLPQTYLKRRKLPKRAEPSTIINCDILEKNIVRGSRRKRFKLPDNAVVPKKRKSQICSGSSTTVSNENEKKILSEEQKVDTNISQEGSLSAESSKKDEINKVWLQGLLNPSVINTNAVLEMLEKLLDTEKFKQVKTILESDKPNDVEETRPVIAESHSTPTANHRKKTELDRLNEDIREMFIRDGVLSATGRRGCTLNKNKISDHAETTKLLKTESKIPVSASRKTKLRSKQKQKGKSPNKTAAEAKSDSSEDELEEGPEEDPEEEILLQLVVGTDTPEVIGTETKGTIKNMNPKMHPLSEYGSQCALCGFQSRYIASHYVNKHHCEVLTSRLPPGVQERLEANGGKTAINTGKFPKCWKTIYNYLCPFCETKLAFTARTWRYHFSMHTGEYFTKCSKCGLRKNKLQTHITKNCPGATIVRTPSSIKDQNVFHAYICDLCNYIQMNRQQIVDHLINQHHSFKEQITEIVLLNLNETDVDIGPPLLERELTSTTTESTEKLKRPALRKRVVVKVKKLNMVEIERIIRESKSKIEVAPTVNEETVPKSSKSVIGCKEEPDVETIVVIGEAKDSVDAVISDETSNLQIFKNIHSEMHTQSKYASYCALCSAKSSYLAIHYINVHKSEVLTSRLPPDVQDRFMQDSTAGSTQKLGRKHWYICPFCDIQKSLVPKVWIDHLSTHTGEYNFKCSKCSYAQSKITAMTNHIQRSCPDAHVIRDTQRCRGKNAILGFICDLCSYIQMNCKNVVQHLISQHNCFEELISTITLINFEKYDICGNQDESIYDNTNIQHSLDLGIDSSAAVSTSQITLDSIKDENLTNSISLVSTGEANEHFSISYVDPEPLEPLVFEVVKSNAPQDNNCIVISDDEDDSVGPKPTFFSGDSSNYQVAENSIDDDENWEDIDSPPQPPQVSNTTTTVNLSVEESKTKNTKTVYPALDRLYASIVETAIKKSLNSQNENESSSSNVSNDTVRINRLAYKESSSGRRYHCLAEFCTFPSTAFLFELKTHLINKHRDWLWGGYCHSCSRIVSIETGLKLLDEFVHMEKVHIRTENTQPYKLATKKATPILKVRHLPGDSLSSFIGQTLSQKKGPEAAASGLATPSASNLNLQASSSANFATNSVQTDPSQLEIASVSEVVVSVGGSLTATTNVGTNITSSSPQLKIANVSSAELNTDVASNTIKCKNLSVPVQSKYRIISLPAGRVPNITSQLPQQKIISMSSAGLIIGGARTVPTNAVTNVTSTAPPLRITNVYSAGSNNSAVSAAHDLGNITPLPAQLKIANVSSASVNASALQSFSNMTSMPSQIKIANVSSAGVSTGVANNITSLPSQLKIASIFSGAIRTGGTNASATQGVSNISSMQSPFKIANVSSAVLNESTVQGDSNITAMPPPIKISRVSSGLMNTGGVNTFPSQGIINISPIPQLKMAGVPIAAKMSAPSDTTNITSPQLKTIRVSSAERNDSAVVSTSTTTTTTMVGKESKTSAPKCTSSSIAEKLLGPNSGKTVLKPWTQSRSVKSEVIVSRLLQKEKLLAFFKCMGNDCDFVTNDSVEMKSHVNAHKSQANETSDVAEWLECCYCNCSPVNVVLLITHYIKKHKTDIYQCPYCFYRTCEEYNVLVHLGNHHEGNEFMIYVCPGNKPDQTIEFKFAENRMMQNVKYITVKDRPKSSPASVVHGMLAKINICTELFQCMLCFPNNAMAGRKEQLLDHLMTQHNVMCYECVHCTFGTDIKHRMNTHMSNYHASHLLFCCVRLEMLKSTLNEQLYIYKELPDRTALVLLKRKVKDKYLQLCQPNVKDAVQVIGNGERKSIKPTPAVKTVQKRKVDSIAQLPRSEIFGVPLFCSMCGYGSKVRMNLLRHFQLHAENESKVANIDPVNPVPCLNAPEKHFDRMTNLACSSNTKK